MKQITPEEQIQNQSETIESLNRKIESLEAELQKRLNFEGDSDTTRVKHHPKDESLQIDLEIIQQCRAHRLDYFH